MPDSLRDQVFQIDDLVRVVGPLAETYGGETGVVRSIAFSGTVFRYLVEFDQSRTETFFGFEHIRISRASTAQPA
jgi:hypothetical protein